MQSLGSVYTQRYTDQSTAAENVVLHYSCVYDSGRFKFNELLYDIAAAAANGKAIVH